MTRHRLPPNVLYWWQAKKSEVRRLCDEPDEREQSIRGRQESS